MSCGNKQAWVSLAKQSRRHRSCPWLPRQPKQKPIEQVGEKAQEPRGARRPFRYLRVFGKKGAIDLRREEFPV